MKALELEVTGSVEAEWPIEGSRRRASRPGRRPHREIMGSAPFVAWDGEGYTDDDGKHHYMLFGNSNGDYVHGEDMTWRECFPLLLNSAGNVNVIYGGDYDIIMMTKDMPYPILDRLLHSKPVKFKGYRMEWYRRKYFMLKDLTDGRSVRLFDVHSFFQCSFVNACKEYLGDDETLKAMHQMKLQRDSFAFNDTRVIGYWQDELAYLVRLMDVLRGLLDAVDIKPPGWYGPGAIASAVLKAKEMGRYYGNVPDEVTEVAEKAYYGGRFEQFKVGKLEQVYEYDIRSAYPAAMSLLPDFSSATWTHIEGEPSNLDPFGIYCVSWDIPRRVLMTAIGPFPWRSETGAIYFPYQGFRSWYWGIEVIECMLKGYRTREAWTIHEAWVPEFSTGERPFRWVREMYDDRARMKAEGNPAQKAYKLALNSLYGKLAQSTGSKLDTETGVWKKPKWHHILWAGWITAATRARLFSVMREAPGEIVAVETDAIFSTVPLDKYLKVGDRLGAWELTDIERILYVQSGHYYALNGGVWKLKSRGVEADKTKSADHWLEIFAQLPKNQLTISSTLRRFGTDLRQPERYGNWYDFEISTTLPNSRSKRMHSENLCITCRCNDSTYADARHWLYVPQKNIDSDWRESTPYKFPWRTDAKYEWPEIVRAEVIELPEEVAWV